MTQVQKLFSYDELFAMAHLAVGHAVLITVEKAFKDEKEGMRMIEDKIKEVIALRWDSPEKDQWRVGIDYQCRCKAVIDLLILYGGIDGAHHKMWCIDQSLRILLGEQYEKIIAESCEGEDGPNTYKHDIGIAP